MAFLPRCPLSCLGLPYQLPRNHMEKCALQSLSLSLLPSWSGHATLTVTSAGQHAIEDNPPPFASCVTPGSHLTSLRYLHLPDEDDSTHPGGLVSGAGEITGVGNRARAWHVL